jgi:hypothetical protein
MQFDKFVGGAGAVAVLFGFLEIAVLGYVDHVPAVLVTLSDRRQ